MRADALTGSNPPAYGASTLWTGTSTPSLAPGAKNAMDEQEPTTSIVPVRIEDEMRSSYIDYAMSVIVGRALPDVRDGLKPVHRRILFAMHEQSNTWNKPFKKSARIVGDVIGKYHPHGDQSVYDALVRMAQDFSMRLPLVDGQGNFGSVDGDPAAAMRYTEVRMTKACAAMLADLEKETVDFGPNYDGSEFEPLVMPTRIPALLVNGSEGIAVGMATKIPPHNLVELVGATIELIENPGATVDDLMKHVKGPDFPTAATIHGIAGIRDAYETGRGSIRIRAKTEVEYDERTGKSAIIVTELPFQVNKARLLEKIAQLLREKSIEGITDLRDESDRHGMRMYIELRRDVMPQVMLNQLYKKTELQKTFGVNMLAIVAGLPRILSLKEVLSHFLDFRRDVVTRRCLFELRKARERHHILMGLKKALDMIDEVVRTIRASRDAEEARQGLIDLLDIDTIQANAILDMRLQRLTGLEINKIIDEIEQIEAFMARLQEILDNESELLGVIRGELEEVRDTLGEPRRTNIVADEGEISLHDLIADEDEVLTLTHSGYVKRTPLAEYRMQKRGGVGLKGMETKAEDVVEDVWVTNTHATLLVFTSVGKVHRLAVHEIPSGGRNARGRPVVNLIPVGQDEKVQAIVAFENFEEKAYILTATRRGIVKKTELSLFKNINAAGIIGVKLNDGDELINARLCREGDHVLLTTKNGSAIRFSQSDVRPMGRATTGVRGVNLREGDEVVAMALMTEEDMIRSWEASGISLTDAIDASSGLDVEDADAPEIEEDIEDIEDIEEMEEAEDIDDLDDEPVVGDDDEEDMERGQGRHLAGCRTVLTITENGYGKRTRFEAYRRQNRGGYGIRTIKMSERNGRVASSHLVDDDDQIILITNTGRIIRTRTSDISILGRTTQGVRIMRLREAETIVGVARFADREDDEMPSDSATASTTGGHDESAGNDAGVLDHNIEAMTALDRADDAASNDEPTNDDE